MILLIGAIGILWAIVSTAISSLTNPQPKKKYRNLNERESFDDWYNNIHHR